MARWARDHLLAGSLHKHAKHRVWNNAASHSQDPELADLTIIAVFSLAIFYWAVAVSMSREKVHEAVEDVEREASVGLETPLA